MNSYIFITLSFLCGMPLFAELNSWPQWRGPARDGQGIPTIDLIQDFEANQPEKLWESIEIPSQDDGGFGSVISDGKRAFLSVVWHRNEPTNERIIDSIVLRKLGLRNVNLPKELKQKVERDRESLSPRLRGSKLDQWIEKWIEDNLDQKQKMTQGSLITSRFKKGKLAIPLWVIDRMFTIRDRVFPSQGALDQWLQEQNFPPEIREKISQGVPPTKRMADDVILALDLQTGTQIWKTTLSGVPSGRSSSSTPCFADNKIYAVGGDRLFCVESENGKLLWKCQLGTEAIASSPLFHDGKVFVLANTLCAFDGKTGEQIWENNSVKGKTASPMIWQNQWQTALVCNSSKTIFCLNPDTGETLWEGPGGGASTPASTENYLVAHGKTEDVGLICYEAKADGIYEKWRFPKLTRRTDSSPLIYGEKAILFGAGMRLCIDLKSGEVLRKVPAKHDISSPILAGGKVLAYEINGSFLISVDAQPEKLSDEQKFKLNALKCTSPALVGTKLLVRKTNGIACFEMGLKKPN
ncbi:MAG: PQQ-binding-like beta-propeller repeat protein [Verrucomicrobiota bacterium]|nr:PQQ-binding-like beta-propeller repeat protein [Verrucomicrobiota bacterium]